MQIRMKVRSQGLQQRIRKTRRVLSHLRPFFAREATRIAYEETRRVFTSEGYGKWAPLSAQYAAWKRRIAPGKKRLRLSDAYFQAATTSHGRGSIHQVSNRGIRIGVDANAFPGRYPELHETGTSRMPARPVFAIANPRIEERVREELEEHIEREVR